MYEHLSKKLEKIGEGGEIFRRKVQYGQQSKWRLKVDYQQ